MLHALFQEIAREQIPYSVIEPFCVQVETFVPAEGWCFASH